MYRLWRDGGFAVGALLAAVRADAFGLETAIWAVAALTAASGIVVALRICETHPRTPMTITPASTIETEGVDLES